MPRENRGVTKVNIYVHEQVLETFRKLARLRGCAYSELIREACREYALKHGPELIAQAKAIKDMAQ